MKKLATYLEVLLMKNRTEMRLLDLSLRQTTFNEVASPT